MPNEWKIEKGTETRFSLANRTFPVVLIDVSTRMNRCCPLFSPFYIVLPIRTGEKRQEDNFDSWWNVVLMRQNLPSGCKRFLLLLLRDVQQLLSSSCHQRQVLLNERFSRFVSHREYDRTNQRRATHRDEICKWFVCLNFSCSHSWEKAILISLTFTWVLYIIELFPRKEIDWFFFINCREEAIQTDETGIQMISKLCLSWWSTMARRKELFELGRQCRSVGDE